MYKARDVKKFALKNYSGVECTVEPVEMSTIVESVKQEAKPIGYAVGWQVHQGNWHFN